LLGVIGSSVTDILTLAYRGPYNGGRYVWDRRISGDIKRDEMVIANFTRHGPALLGGFVIFFVADARL
jgi:hypothetical protein